MPQVRLRSLTCTEPSTLVLKNDSSRRARPLWLDYNGDEVSLQLRHVGCYGGRERMRTRGCMGREVAWTSQPPFALSQPRAA